MIQPLKMSITSTTPTHSWYQYRRTKRKSNGCWGLVDKYAQANVPADVNYFLGTDGLGRDVLSRLFMGTRISLLIAFIAALLDVTIGVAYGFDLWFVRVVVDNAMQRFLEVLSGIPNLVVMILMLVVFGNQGSSRSSQRWRSRTGFRWLGSSGRKP